MVTLHYYAKSPTHLRPEGCSALDLLAFHALDVRSTPATSSSVLHWLISQALFVDRTEVLDTNGQAESSGDMSIGYSPLAILLALLLGSGMVLEMVLNGMRKLRGGVLVGNNSLAIAAACQRPEWEKGAELGKVRWGAVWYEERGVPGHCCFSASESVEIPREGICIYNVG
jgi:hypothetical protein